MGRGFDFWDALILIGSALILGWALLKALGVLHSPTWVDMIPYFGVGASIVGGAYKLGKIKNSIEETHVKVDRLLKIEERFSRIEHEHNLMMQKKLNIH
jgi:hypothetical protein